MFVRVLFSALAILAPALAADEDAENRDEASKPRQTVVLPHAEPPTDVPYPERGKGAARVVLGLTIESDGSVSRVDCMQGNPPFSTAAVAAAKSWHFTPALIDGVPRRARVRFEVRFSDPRRALARRQSVRGPASEPTPDAGAADSRLEEPAIEVNVEEAGPSDPRALTRAEVRELPGAFGDPFRSVEALPGVTPIASGLPYFFVRGAPPGNVGYFFDGIRVPVLYHVALGPSVIHPAFIERVDLHAGPYPARYGRFAGGVVAAEATEPLGQWRGEASVRLYDAGAMIEAPFDRGRGNILLGGRYSYTAAIVSLIAPEVELSYWDYQARVAYDLTRADRLSLFAFGSADFVASETTSGRNRTVADIAFHRADLRYDRRLSETKSVRLATTLGTENTGAEGQPLRADADLVRLRGEYRSELASLRFRAGVDLERTAFTTVIDETEIDQDEQGGIREFRNRYSDRLDFVSGAYAEAELELTPHLELRPGVRVDVYASGDASDFGVSPRLEATYKLTPALSVTHGLGVADQPPSFVIPLPGIQPVLGEGLQRSLQSSAGILLALPHALRLSLTVFQSIQFNTSDALGVSRLDNGDPDVNQQTRSLGSTRGIEVLVRRDLTRRLGGYLAYTLSRSERSLGRAEGPSSFDRTHVFSTALAYDLGRRWRAGGRFTFYTGIPGDVAYLEVARHPPRTDLFYRLDWRLEKRWLIGAGIAWWSLVFEVLNTTLNEEMINKSCSAYTCREERIGPVTLPSVGVEAAF